MFLKFFNVSLSRYVALTIRWLRREPMSWALSLGTILRSSLTSLTLEMVKLPPLEEVSHVWWPRIHKLGEWLAWTNLTISFKEREVSLYLCKLLEINTKLMCVYYDFNIMVNYFSFIHPAYHVLLSICLYYQLMYYINCCSEHRDFSVLSSLTSEFFTCWNFHLLETSPLKKKKFPYWKQWLVH